MALRIYKCPSCGAHRETLKKKSLNCNHGQESIGTPIPESIMEEVLSAPNQKFMITANKATGTSKLKDSEKVLKARARSHSRDVLGDDNIQINKLNGLDAQVNMNLLNSKLERRRKIDDI